MPFLACERDLSHREKVWNDLKDKNWKRFEMEVEELEVPTYSEDEAAFIASLESDSNVYRWCNRSGQ